MKNRKYILYAITVLLLLLWIPVALDKVIHYTAFKYGILRQPLHSTLAWIAIYTLPVLEIIVAVLLATARYRRWGFIFSSLLMAVFTGYIALALLGAWHKLPCGCGSVINGMTWKQHFWFNLFFLAISVVGWRLEEKSKNVMSKE